MGRSLKTIMLCFLCVNDSRLHLHLRVSYFLISFPLLLSTLPLRSIRFISTLECPWVVFVAGWVLTVSYLLGPSSHLSPLLPANSSVPFAGTTEERDITLMAPSDGMPVAGLPFSLDVIHHASSWSAPSEKKMTETVVVQAVAPLAIGKPESQ
ncbi:hypothetical protein BJY52DRAFT_449488 [Lactarius psammicola]|nr:hypothetical protein BJY52DRAFT_449488 [Lactarius psammicola]